jgi:hypothetical protein
MPSDTKFKLGARTTRGDEVRRRIRLGQGPGNRIEHVVVAAAFLDDFAQRNVRKAERVGPGGSHYAANCPATV